MEPVQGHLLAALGREVMLPTSNAEFLAGIFGTVPDKLRPLVCGFVGNPSDGSGHNVNWASWPWEPNGVADGEGRNWFFVPALFRPNADGRYARSAEQCATIFAVMCDDVGTKVDRHALDRLPPSVLIETSAGNHQALYLFREPITDKVIAGTLMQRLIAAKLCDPQATGPAARYCRMPFGVNGKHSPPFPCRLIEWHPDRRYAVEEIVTGLALPDVHAAVPADAAPAPDWECRTEHERRRLTSELRRALQAIPMDSRVEYVATGQNLRCLGDVGRELWTAAIEKSEKYRPGDEDRWDGFDGTRSDYRAIFTRAMSYGWVNEPLASEVFSEPVCLPPGASLTPLQPATIPAAAVPFVRVPIADLAYAAPEPQLWWCESYLPAGHVTLLGGHGGAGKSTLALMLAVSVAVGMPFLGLQIRQGRILYFSAEDPASMVRRRLSKICKQADINPADLAPAFHVLDATEGAPVLFAEQRSQGVRSSTTTATYDALRTYVETYAIDVIVVDNSSDVFDADEINRASVRGFISSLARLVRPRGGAVLLLAHVDKLTSRAGRGSGSESYSGSTAWHNSVRSRLFLTEGAPGMLELRHEKSNLGPKREQLALVWPPEKLPQLLLEMMPAVAAAADDAALCSLLSLIHERYQRGESISPGHTSTSSAAKILSAEASYPKRLKPMQVQTMLSRAHGRTLLERELYRKADRKSAERWKLTPQGLALISAATAATAQLL